MGLKDVDIEGGLRRIADRKIEEAMREGKFDNLPGAGKPIDLETPPAEENARLAWWALKMLKQNDVVPDEVVWRKQVDGLREAVAAAVTDRQLVELVAKTNALVLRVNTLGTNAIRLPLVPLDLADERRKLRERTGQ